VRVIGLSCSTKEKHIEWVCDVNNIMQCKVEFPIISDNSRTIAQSYNMLDWQEPTNVDKDNVPYTHRSVYIIDPKSIIRYFPINFNLI
jgi:alkyl hydroperoxide reductase subunit AhpC